MYGKRIEEGGGGGGGVNTLRVNGLGGEYEKFQY